MRLDTLDRIDPDGMRYVAHLMVWAHWGLGVVCLFQLLYRPYWGAGTQVAYCVLFGSLMAYNGYIHRRLVAGRANTAGWVLSLSALDIAVISVSAAISGGFSHYFFHLFYFPALALFAVTFTSFRLNMAWVTAVAAIYLAISMAAGDGLDFDARDEKPLVMRISIMYAVAAAANLVSRFERTRWREATQSERALQRDRVEFSQAVHDTTAQSAYMIGLGLDTARAQAEAENASAELLATLDATSRLSRTTTWELRRPINMGGIYEGRGLVAALRSHTASFTNVTSVPAETTFEGQEPQLPVETRSRLFSIAHNALTNAYRHADATRVQVHIAFGDDEIRLTVSDDGAGLPPDYADRGRGFAGMRRDAERLGGRLDVQPQGPAGGATIICAIPPPVQAAARRLADRFS